MCWLAPTFQDCKIESINLCLQTLSALCQWRRGQNNGITRAPLYRQWPFVRTLDDKGFVNMHGFRLLKNELVLTLRLFSARWIYYRIRFSDQWWDSTSSHRFVRICSWNFFNPRTCCWLKSGVLNFFPMNTFYL